MPSAAEYNQFRRLVGDYGTNTVPNGDIQQYLDDATYETTSDFPTPVTSFDTLKTQYHPETIYKAAINWWWNRAASLSAKHTTTVGTASQQIGETWDRAMQIIAQLQIQYDTIQMLGIDIDIGNLSYWSKSTLTRRGGQSEEDAITNE